MCEFLRVHMRRSEARSRRAARPLLVKKAFGKAAQPWSAVAVGFSAVPRADTIARPQMEAVCH